MFQVWSEGGDRLSSTRKETQFEIITIEGGKECRPLYLSNVGKENVLRVTINLTLLQNMKKCAVSSTLILTPTWPSLVIENFRPDDDQY